MIFLKMKNLLTALFLFSIGFFVLTGCEESEEPEPITDEPIKVDLFQKDAAGWTITGDAQGGYTEASYSPDGGVKDGYIYADDDVAGGVWYFTAPSSYHGNKSEYYGATLKFSLFQESAMKKQFEKADIIFKNGSDEIYYLHDSNKYPGPDWTHYSVKISAGNGWFKGKYKSEVEASEADIKKVLSNVTEFHIRGEFETGPDNGGMDNIVIDK